ncbi:MAG: hypothetical protein AMXMBFR84_11080 [Candidatus Hydrogenedentota bacterium]
MRPLLLSMTLLVFLAGCDGSIADVEAAKTFPIPLNVDSPTDGYCLRLPADPLIAYPRELPDLRRTAEGSSPYGKPESGGIRIAVSANANQLFDEKYQGREVEILNESDTIKKVPVHDFRLWMVQEALDGEGQWRPIERLRLSGCGLSDFHAALAPGQYWVLTVPVYEGEIRTWLRIRLELYDSEVVYSEPYLGGVNPGQFLPAETISGPRDTTASS